MAAAKIKATVAIAAAVLLVGAAVPTAYHYATARPEPIVAGPPPQVQAALTSITPQPPLPAGTDLSRPVSGSLPPGMTAEPIAIMNKVDKRWIRPTGEELANPPAIVQQLLSSLSRMNIPNATHALLFRISAADMTSVSWSYSIGGSNGYSSSGTYDPATQSNYMVMVFAPSRGANAVTLKVEAADGPWTNNVVIPASATTPTKGSVSGYPVTFGPPTEQNNQVKIKRPMAGVADGICSKFYGLDTAGEKSYSHGMTGDRQGNYIYTFSGPLSSYKEFRLDSRPYNYHATYAPVPLAFSK